MQLDGLKSSQGPQGPDRGAGPRKADPKAGGKSFADALGKAQAQNQPVPAENAPKPDAQPLPSGDSHLDAIRFRLQSGYYNNPKVDDALSDKLSGFFDDVA
jgi:hypothetical protein